MTMVNKNTKSYTIISRVHITYASKDPKTKTKATRGRENKTIRKKIREN